MSDSVVSSVKFALIGSAVGTLAAVGADALYGVLVPVIAPPSSGSSPADSLGRASLALVTSSAMAALALYGGEALMEYAGGKQDPLAGVFFYHTCLTQMRTAEVAPRIVRQLLSSLKPSAPTRGPSRDPGDQVEAQTPAPSARKAGCMSGCGAIDFR